VKRLEYEWNKVFKIYTEKEEIVVENSNADSLFVNFLNLIIFLYFKLNKMFLSYRKMLNKNLEKKNHHLGKGLSFLPQNKVKFLIHIIKLAFVFVKHFMANS
jgi:hypothetical protein